MRIELGFEPHVQLLFVALARSGESWGYEAGLLPCHLYGASGQVEPCHKRAMSEYEIGKAYKCLGLWMESQICLSD